MAAKDYLDIHTSTDATSLQRLENSLGKYEALRKKAEEEYFELQRNNINELARLKVAELNKEKAKKLAIEQEVNKKMIQMGIETKKVLEKNNLVTRIKALEEEEKARLKQASGAKAKQIIKKEIAEKKKAEINAATEIEKTRLKLFTDTTKKQAKDYQKQLTSAVKSSFSEAGLTTLGGALFGRNAAKQAIKEAHPEWSDKQIALESSKQQANALKNALNDFAKQLEGSITDIATAQTEIDTRLQGSSSRKRFGSYWKAMSQDITKYVGMSPYIKQADVANNLKTMVGLGISFDVEQRAFLATIADKIATTFNANDGTLRQLIRIQQQDSTAARLGMESALTSFLNNMYETTEYMGTIAEGIRQNIYEASALMTAKSATEFEYQIQKWMGSLYSVGFNNTSGLSSALGKLAAGDISSIADGGFGNLLVMAANRANMPIADILADGLDSSETNQLMQAMVNYLGQIYNETHGSNILAQQYAGVFGLTASDLKAAANLAKSVGNISSNNLSNAGMLTQLSNMANSMGSRISTGGMMTTMFENLKYATASSMANNPILYTIYSLASMLDSTVGGITIPSAMAMGTGFDLETTIADLMRVASLSGGLLDGIGTMLTGLGTGGGFSGTGMLKAFGALDSNVVSRGTGAGLLTTSTQTISESGYTANANSSDIQSKTLTDASDSAETQVQSKKEESTDIQLKEVNESVVKIYELLYSISGGGNSFRVDMGDVSAWTTAFRQY